MRNRYADRLVGVGHYFDREGQPMPLMCWANMTQNVAYRRVAYTSLGPEDQYGRVSKVWLGVSISLAGGPGMIFETMVFSDRSELDQYQWKHATVEDAILIHDMVANSVRMELGLP